MLTTSLLFFKELKWYVLVSSFQLGFAILSLVVNHEAKNRKDAKAACVVSVRLRGTLPILNPVVHCGGRAL